MKSRSFLLDGDFILDLLENTSVYQSTEIAERQYRKVFGSIDQIFLNIQQANIFNNKRMDALVVRLSNTDEESPEDEALKNSFYYTRMVEIRNNTVKWEPLEYYEILDGKVEIAWEDEKDLSATFVDKNDLIATHRSSTGNFTKKQKIKKDKNLDYSQVKEIAQQQKGHYIEMNDIFNSESEFRSAINFENSKLIVVADSSSVGKKYDSSCMKGFQNPSKEYLVWDAYLLQDANILFNPESFEKLLKLYCFFIDWAYSNKSPDDNELPSIYFGGKQYTYKGFNRTDWADIDFQAHQKTFLSKVKKLSNSHPSILRFQELIKNNKIKFFGKTYEEYNKDDTIYDLHENMVLLDYGYLSWGHRRNSLIINGPDKNLFFLPIEAHLIIMQSEMENKKVESLVTDVMTELEAVCNNEFFIPFPIDLKDSTLPLDKELLFSNRIVVKQGKKGNYFYNDIEIEKDKFNEVSESIKSRILSDLQDKLVSKEIKKYFNYKLTGQNIILEVKDQEVLKLIVENIKKKIDTKLEEDGVISHPTEIKIITDQENKENLNYTIYKEIKATYATFLKNSDSKSDQKRVDYFEKLLKKL